MIFVFGSNQVGRHGAGAALFAKKYRGAINGQGVGMQGDSYAIPTKDGFLKPLALNTIWDYVDQFINYAQQHPEVEFEVTRVGCGLAGYSDSDMAPMFKGCPINCYLPDGWR